MKGATAFAWTAAHIEILKVKWAAGESAAVIAAEFGGVTRSAVLGKVHRLKLKSRETSPPKAAKRISQPNASTARGGVAFRIGKARQAGLHGAEAMAAVLGRPEPVTGLGDAAPTAGGLVRLEDLGRDDCRWPFGDPLTKDFGFCGHQVADGEAYCKVHCRKAYPGWQR